jgi:hypothetical protein
MPPQWFSDPLRKEVSACPLLVESLAVRAAGSSAAAADNVPGGRASPIATNRSFGPDSDAQGAISAHLEAQSTDNYSGGITFARIKHLYTVGGSRGSLLLGDASSARTRDSCGSLVRQESPEMTVTMIGPNGASP